MTGTARATGRIAAGALVVVPRLAFSDAPHTADLRSVAPATGPASGGQA